MSTKRNGVPCYDKAGEDEPLFVLRGQDITSPATIRFWVEANPQLRAEVAAEALDCAIQMEKWPKRKWAD